MTTDPTKALTREVKGQKPATTLGEVKSVVDSRPRGPIGPATKIAAQNKAELRAKFDGIRSRGRVG